MRLPVNVPFHKDETPVSIASRLAMAMGMPSLSTLMQGGDVTALALSRGDPQAIQRLSAWTGVESGQLSRYAVRVTYRKAEWRIGNALFYKESRPGTRMRFCAKCVVEDLQTGFGRPASRPYVRATWRSRAIENCPIHACAITETSGGSDTHDGDFCRFVETNLGFIYQIAGHQVENRPNALDRYLEERIIGKPATSFLDRQEAHIVVSLCAYFGQFLQRHFQNDNENSVLLNSLTAREAGFHVARNGEAAIKDFVRAALEESPPLRTSGQDFFGKRFLSWLKRNVDGSDYQNVIDLFQSLGEHYLPIGPEEQFLRPVSHRRVHSVRSAAAQHNMTEKRVFGLLTEAGIINDRKHTSARTYFDAAAADALLSRSSRSLTTTEVAAKLGIFEGRVRDLINRGVLPRSEKGLSSHRAYSRVVEADLNTFLDRLFSKKSPLPPNSSLVSLPDACRRCCCRLFELLELILNEQITTVACGDDSRTIGSLYVDCQEVDELLRQRRKAEGVFVNRVDASLMLSVVQGTIPALIARGLLKAERRPNPKTKAHHTYVHVDELEAFRKEHISLASLAKSRGVSPRLMKKELDLNGIASIMTTDNTASKIYRKSDLKALGFI